MISDTDSSEWKFHIGTTKQNKQIMHSVTRSTNFHHLLLGTSGVGKTWNIQNFIANYNGLGVTSIALDTQGDFQPDCFDSKLDLKPSDFNILKFDYIGESCSINPLAITNTGESSDFQFALMNAIEAIKLFNSSLGSQQEALLETLLYEVYERSGILPKSPTSWSNEAPTIIELREIVQEYLAAITSGLNKNLYEQINENRKKALSAYKVLNSDSELTTIREDALKEDLKFASEALKNSFSEAVDRQIEGVSDETLSINKERLVSIDNTLKQMIRSNLFCGQNIAIKSNKINVVDLSQVTPKHQPVLFHLFLFRTFQSSVIMNRRRLNQKTPNIMLIFDEGKLFSSAASSNLSPINRILTEGRKYGLGSIIGIQQPNQINQEMRSSIATKLVLPIDREFYNYATRNWGLTEEMLNTIEPRKDALYSVNNTPFQAVSTFC